MLKKDDRLWHVKVDQWGSCPRNRDLKNPCANCPYNTDCHRYTVRHRKIDKNKRAFAFGDFYCVDTLVNDYNHHQPVPFAESEMHALQDLIQRWR